MFIKSTVEWSVGLSAIVLWAIVDKTSNLVHGVFCGAVPPSESRASSAVRCCAGGFVERRGISEWVFEFSSRFLYDLDGEPTLSNCVFVLCT